ncbi:MAG: hypothetical protein WCX69_01755 [Candidatus Paceibacterota bacterium]
MDMNTNRSRSIAIVTIIFLLGASFGFNVASAATPFGPQKPAETGFGGDTEAATDKWIEGSVRQVNGALQIKSNGQGVTLDPADFGGKDGFIWKVMEAATKDGQIMAKEDLEKLVNAIIEKYLLHIDNWPKVKSLLQSWNVTDEKELSSLLVKFESSNPLWSTIESMQNVANISLTSDSNISKASPTATSIVGKYDPETKKFITVGTYKDGKLIDWETGTVMSDSMMKGSSLYQRLYIGTTTGHDPVRIYGDDARLANLDKAVELVGAFAKTKEGAYAGLFNSDGTPNENAYVCADYSYDAQAFLKANGIDAYGVMYGGAYRGESLAHAEIAIKTGEVKYPDGSVYPTFAVIEPQTGFVMGQLGGPGTQTSDTYNTVGQPMTFEDAIVIKDFQLEPDKYIGQVMLHSDGNEIYTYMATAKPHQIDIDNKGRVSLGDVFTNLVTDIPTTNDVIPGMIDIPVDDADNE